MMFIVCVLFWDARHYRMVLVILIFKFWKKISKISWDTEWIICQKIIWGRTISFNFTFLLHYISDRNRKNLVQKLIEKQSLICWDNFSSCNPSQDAGNWSPFPLCGVEEFWAGNVALWSQPPLNIEKWKKKKKKRHLRPIL